MMVEPGLDVLLPNVDSKYTLVSVSSKRARKIMTKADAGLDNPVTVALQEIADGKIEWVRTEGTAQDECEECEACEGSEDCEECAETDTAADAVETEEVDG